MGELQFTPHRTMQKRYSEIHPCIRMEGILWRNIGMHFSTNIRTDMAPNPQDDVDATLLIHKGFELENGDDG